jgi:hypothetical protein
VLGVCIDASPDEIAAAWKRSAREYHPDAPCGDETAFRMAKEAADRLLGAALPEAVDGRRSPVRARRVPRSFRQVAIGDAVAADCATALASGGAARATLNDSGAPVPGGLAPADRVAKNAPVGLDRNGRQVRFRMAEPLHPGRNRIALPCPFSIDRVARRGGSVKVTIIEIVAGEGPNARVQLDTSLGAGLFEGSVEVELRFPQNR